MRAKVDVGFVAPLPRIKIASFCSPSSAAPPTTNPAWIPICPRTTLRTWFGGTCMGKAAALLSLSLDGTKLNNVMKLGTGKSSLSPHRYLLWASDSILTRALRLFTLTAFVDAYGERELPIVHFWRHTGPTLTTPHPLSRAPTSADLTVSVPSTPAAHAHAHRDHTCRKAAQNALHYFRRRRPRICVRRLNPTFSSQKTPAAKFASERTKRVYY